jgi:hypothetical protein
MKLSLRRALRFFKGILSSELRYCIRAQIRRGEFDYSNQKRMKLMISRVFDFFRTF